MTERYLPIPMELRWSDQDLMGHVNNARVVTLAEEARIRFHRHLDGSGAGAESAAAGGPVVARQVIDYHRPAHYGLPLEVRVGVLRVGNSSFTLRHQGVQDDQPVFTVDAVIVMTTPDGSSRPLTNAQRTGLEDWRWPDAEDTGARGRHVEASGVVTSDASPGAGT